MKNKIVSETPISAAEVLADLEAIKQKDGELNYRAARTHEYLGQLVAIKPQMAKKVVAALKELNVPRVREQHLVKLVDVMPTTPADIKTVLQGYAVTITNDNLQKMADVLATHAKQ